MIETVTEIFQEWGFAPTPDVVDTLAKDVFAVRTLVDAACTAYVRAESCTDPLPGLHAARRAANERFRELIDESWDPLIEYLAIAGTSSAKEAGALDREGVVPALVAARVLAPSEMYGEDCVRLAPAIAAAARRRMDGPRVDETRRTIVHLRSRIGSLDFGMAACMELDDAWLAGRLLERVPARVNFGPFRSLYRRFLSEQPLESAAEHHNLGHRLELQGRIPVGTTPLRTPRDLQDVRDLSGTDPYVPFLSSTTAAMGARRRWDPKPSAAEVARKAAPIVAYALQHLPSARTLASASLWYLQAGISCQLGADDVAAQDFYRAAWEFRTKDDSGFAAADIAGKQALLLANDGATDAARTWLDRHDRATVEPWVDPSTVDHVQHAAALARIILATDALDDGSVDFTEWGSLEMPWDAWWGFAAWARARAAIAMGRAAQVERIIAEETKTFSHGVTGSPLQLAQLAEVRAEAALAMRRPHQAASLVAEIPGESRYGRVARSRLALVSGDPATARTLAATYRHQSDSRTRDITELLIIEGLSCLQLDEHAEAMELLTEGLDQAAQRHDRRVLTTLPRAVMQELAGLGAIPDSLRVEEIELAGWGEVFPEEAPLIRLSPREHDVLRDLATSASLATIASDHWVTRETIKSQTKAIYRKLGVASRQEAVRRAAELGLLEPRLTEQRRR